MAIRNIREIGEPVLNKVSKEVTEVNERIRELIDDMCETLYESGGVGLAAPQVGVLKRIVVIDLSIASDDEEPEYEPFVMINPRIVESSGEQTGDEGCLSVPGKVGRVTRPNYVKAVFLNEDMQACEIEGTELMARCICHELDHLDGHIYTEKVEGELREVKEDPEA